MMTEASKPMPVRHESPRNWFPMTGAPRHWLPRHGLPFSIVELVAQVAMRMLSCWPVYIAVVLAVMLIVVLGTK